MKKHVLMLFTLLLVICFSSLFADRDIQGSTITCQQPYYVPGPAGTTNLSFDLDIVNSNILDPARATTILLNFPVGVAVANTGSVPINPEPTDFMGVVPTEYLDYGLEIGDGTSVTTITFSDLTGVLPGILDNGPVDGTANVTVVIDPVVWNSTDMTIGYSIIGIKGAILLGILAGILNIIPYLGPAIVIVATSPVANQPSSVIEFAVSSGRCQ